jgi:hypothetical protein
VFAIGAAGFAVSEGNLDLYSCLGLQIFHGDFELELHPQFLDTADNPLSGEPLDSGPEKATVSGLSVRSDCTRPTSELK